MPSPLVHTLLPTSLVATSSVHKALPRGEKIRFFVVCVFLANCPDFDLMPTIFNEKLWEVVHRWYGHNLIAFTLLVLAGVWLLGTFVPTLTVKQRRLTALLLVTSHLVLDSMVAPLVPHTGVPLLWPFSEHCAHFPVLLFPSMNNEKGIHQLVGFAFSTNNWKYVFGAEFLMSMALWALLTMCGRLWVQVGHYTKNVPIKTRDVLNLFSRSSRQYSPEPPSPRHQDDNPSHTYKDSGLGS